MIGDECQGACVYVCVCVVCFVCSFVHVFFCVEGVWGDCIFDYLCSAHSFLISLLFFHIDRFSRQLRAISNSVKKADFDWKRLQEKFK